MEDVWRAPCPAPAGALPRVQSSVTAPGTQAAVNATLAMIKAFGKPLFWAGVEIQRQGLQRGVPGAGGPQRLFVHHLADGQVGGLGKAPRLSGRLQPLGAGRGEAAGGRRGVPGGDRRLDHGQGAPATRTS